jgi:hypothetical protein
MQMDVFEFKRPQSVLFRVALGLGVITTTVALGLFAYLGTFTRFLADDYCDTVTVNSGPILPILIEQYETNTDRFSNILFIALSEFLFPHNVEILPVIVIFLWTAVLTWLIYETRRIIKWQWHFFLDFFLAALLVFFAILQAPNRFQTFYWRSAMATHFAPLMYLTTFAAFLLMVARRNQDRYPSIWMGFLLLVLSFLGGGFSEPPDAVLIIASALALAAAWVWVKGQFRRPALMLLSWTLAGGLLALLVMALSPGNILGRSQAHRPEFAALAYHTFLYSALFIRDTFLTFPLPTLFSIAIPFFLFYGIFATTSSLSSTGLRTLWIVMIAIPILAYVLIAASFAPSVYGQAFPAERARFLGRLLMTATLMLEGVCFGILLAQWKMRWSSTATVLAMILLALSAFYPPRAAWAIVQNKRPFYSLWSSVWDYRQAQIIADKSKGEKDIVSFQMYSMEGIGELDANPNSWINACAASFYGVHSISAP